MECQECGWEGPDDELVEREGVLTSSDRLMSLKFFMGITRTDRCCPRLAASSRAAATYTRCPSSPTGLDGPGRPELYIDGHIGIIRIERPIGRAMKGMR